MRRRRGGNGRGWWALVALVAVLALVAACGRGGGGDSGSTRDTVPPNVVPEPASAWTSITVRSTAPGGRAADVPASLRATASPLLTGRLLSSPQAPSAYGLDAPVATIVYRGAHRVRTIVVGSMNFDGHGYYVQRKGDRRVFLVPADQLGPLLDLVR